MIPQDINPRWVAVKPKLESMANGHKLSLMTTGVVVVDGDIKSTMEPIFQGIEAMPTADPRSWWSVVRRLQSIGIKRDRCLLLVSIALGEGGEPVWWTSPVCINYE